MKPKLKLICQDGKFKITETDVITGEKKTHFECKFRTDVLRYGTNGVGFIECLTPYAQELIKHSTLFSLNELAFSTMPFILIYDGEAAFIKTLKEIVKL